MYDMQLQGQINLVFEDLKKVYLIMGKIVQVVVVEGILYLFRYFYEICMVEMRKIRN